MLRGQFQLIPLLGQSGQFMVRREICRPQLDRLRPALDPRRQRTVDILEGLLRGNPRCRVAGFADSVENAAGLGLHPGLMTQKRELQGDVEIGWSDPHRGGKLIARRLVLPYFQVGVGQVLTNRGSRRRRVNCF